MQQVIRISRVWSRWWHNKEEIYQQPFSNQGINTLPRFGQKIQTKTPYNNNSPIEEKILLSPSIDDTTIIDMEHLTNPVVYTY